MYWNGDEPCATGRARCTSPPEPHGDSPRPGHRHHAPERSGSISGRVFLGDCRTTRRRGPGRGDRRVLPSERMPHPHGRSGTFTDERGAYSFSGPRERHLHRQLRLRPRRGVPRRLSRSTTIVSHSRQLFDAQDVTIAAYRIPSRAPSALGPNGTLAGADEVVVTATPTRRVERLHRHAPTPMAGIDSPASPLGGYDLRFDYVGHGGFADQVWPRHPAVGTTSPTSRRRHRRARATSACRGGRIPLGTVRNSTGAPIPGVSGHGEGQPCTTRWAMDDLDLGSRRSRQPTARTRSGICRPRATRSSTSGRAGDLHVGVHRPGPRRGRGPHRRATRRCTGSRVLSGTIRCDRCGELRRRPSTRRATRAQRRNPRAARLGRCGQFVTDVRQRRRRRTTKFRNTDGGLVPGIYRATVVGRLGAGAPGRTSRRRSRWRTAPT